MQDLLFMYFCLAAGVMALFMYVEMRGEVTFTDLTWCFALGWLIVPVAVISKAFRR